MSLLNSLVSQSGVAGEAARAGGYQIQRSLRFNSADTAYLQRTLATPTSRKTMTFSFWTKRVTIAKYNQLWNNYVGALAYGQFTFGNGDKIEIYSRDSGGTITVNLQSTALYRDVSAWYHIVVAIDTTQATSADRVKLYVNGEQVTSFSTATYPSQNTDTEFQVASRIAAIGRRADGGDSSQNLAAYLAEYYLIDGQALTPSDFGETDATTGVWKPKEYTGTYGTNGFYLNFSDNTSTTTLGTDSSGNGNNWTLTNFSVASGADNDSLVDTPTPYGTDTGAGGEVRGNYCTLNPLSNTSGTWSNGNLRFVGPSSTRRSNGTIAISTGKWYWEVTLGNAPESPRNSTTNYNAFGFGLSTVFGSTAGASTQTDAVILGDSGYYKNFSGLWTDGGTGFSSGDTLAIAVDLDANTFTFYRNNTQITTGTIGGTAGRELTPIIISYSGSYGVMDCNFGQRPFAYTAPSGFKALCTQNLPTPTIKQGNDYHNAVLYTGSASVGNQNVTGFGFDPDFVWIKARSGVARGHVLFDQVRGDNAALYSHATAAEATWIDQGFITDGYTVSATYSSETNANGESFVMWGWNAGGSNATNTDGTITSTVRANPTAGFSIVGYTGNGVAGATVGHGLGAAPAMIIVKNRDQADAWQVYHQANTANPETDYLVLNTTAATADAADRWNDTAPTSTVFSIGNGVEVNTNTEDYIAYVFAEIEGFSKIGSYTGNGSADGPFIYCGFRPAYVLIKGSTYVSNWNLLDDKRDQENPADLLLRPNLTDAEFSSLGDGSGFVADFVSNGFKLRQSYADSNSNNNTLIFMAFAENPFKYSLAR